jgi:hypothetical protein
MGNEQFAMNSISSAVLSGLSFLPSSLQEFSLCYSEELCVTLCNSD